MIKYCDWCHQYCCKTKVTKKINIKQINTIREIFEKNSNLFDNGHKSIALFEVKPIDVAIHNLMRMLVVFVAFTSKLPGILFLVPAIINFQFPQIYRSFEIQLTLYSLNLLSSYFRLLSLYFLAVVLFLCLSVYLYFVSENAAPREQLCRYLDAPQVIYPADCDEDKIRNLVEKGFIFKHLGSERDWNVRIISVSIAILLSS